VPTQSHLYVDANLTAFDGHISVIAFSSESLPRT
jgi:hypothetical protein